jgi:hypothetical protein
MPDKLRIYNLLHEVTQLNEYSLAEKNQLIRVVNTLVLFNNQNPNPELDKKLNDILEFYRYYQTGIPIENKFVFDEFKNKLMNLVKKYQVPLK